MRRDGQAIIDAVALRALQNHCVLGTRRDQLGRILPEKAREAALTHTMNRIDETELMLVEPARPFCGVIVEANALAGRSKEIDMVAERKPADRKSTRLNSSH